MEVIVPSVDHATCNSNYNGGINETAEICAAFASGGKDSCQGDSGGPLSYLDPADGKWYLGGVVSWGAGCALAGKPGVYARVSTYLPWIQSTMCEISSLASHMTSCGGGGGGEPVPNPNPAPSGECASFSGCNCGPIPDSSLTEGIGRVIGGSDSRPNGWPWLVRYAGRGLCGASVIRLSDDIEQSDIILSARHCHTTASGNGANVVLGDYQYNSQDATEVTLPIQEAITLPEHPEGYDGVSPGPHGNRWGGWGDIVILKTASPVTFNSAIQPVCLPSANGSPNDGDDVFLVGWGLYSQDATQAAMDIANIPQEIKMQKTPDADPICGTPNATAEFCAKIGTDMEGACRGDSGGPLTFSSPENNGAFTLAGIVSYGSIGDTGGVGTACNVGGSAAKYTRVSTYVDWIKDTVCAKSAFAAQLPYC